MLDEAVEKGCSLAFNKKQLDAAESKVIGLFENTSMATYFDENSSEQFTREPKLSEMTEYDLNVLSKDPEGFFLMVEAGQIDKAAHRNDAGWMLQIFLNQTI